jgi:hypothetical protein
VGRSELRAAVVLEEAEEGVYVLTLSGIVVGLFSFFKKAVQLVVRYFWTATY